MGANTAIIDACELGRAVVEAVGAGQDLVEALGKYAEIMVPRGRTQVLESRATGESEDAREVAGGRL
jgi:2-polyprenyl-6-methoxyphenol hydroxylase-like FAD-dependent oxidoreductase